MSREPATPTMEKSTTDPHSPRRPQQERGQRRVDAILDAAARIIREEGIAAVAMHRVAKLSGTTTGSMYHFFPDRESLLRGLSMRHAEAIRRLMAALERDATERWPLLTTEEAVDAFVCPFQGYLDQNPDLLPLARLARTATGGMSRNAELDALVIRIAEALVASRDPTATRDERTSRAATVLGILEGVMSATSRTETPGSSGLSIAALRTALRRELRRALVAYLDSYRLGGAAGDAAAQEAVAQETAAPEPRHPSARQ